MLKNKKAQLAEISMIMVALIIAIATLQIFLTSNNKFSSDSEKTTIMLEEINFNQIYIEEQTKIIFSQAIKNCEECEIDQLKKNFKQIAKWYEQKFFRAELGNFYSQIGINKFKIEKHQENLVLKIPDLFLQSNIPSTTNKIRRNYEICMEFDNKGNYLKKCSN